MQKLNRKIIATLDIENYLYSMEEVCLKHVSIPDRWYFSKFSRKPIEAKELDSKDSKNLLGNISSLLSKSPFYPFLCVEFMSEIVESRIVEDSGLSELFRTNHLLKEEVGTVFPQSESIDVDSYILEKMPEISHHDLHIIRDSLNKIYNEVKVYTENNPETIFTIDASGYYVYLVDNGNIKSFRYDEYMDSIKESDSSEYKDNVTVYDIKDSGLRRYVSYNESLRVEYLESIPSIHARNVFIEQYAKDTGIPAYALKDYYAKYLQ